MLPWSSMKWLEEIRIKTQPRRENEVRQIRLEASVSAIIRDRELRSADAYSHYPISAGFTLILVWDTPSIPVNASDTAIMIMEGIKPLGLIDHNVLVDIGHASKK